MATLEEIGEAVDCLDQSRLAILHCVSSYPLKYEDANLRNIVTLREQFPLPVGFSNHALGHDLDIAAVACGAVLIEKHFTLDRKDPKPAEHHFSMEPGEFRELVKRVRMIERALGSSTRILGAEELQNRALARRSVAVNRDVVAGAVLGAEDLILIRPGTGIEPKHLAGVVGKRLTRSVKAFAPLAWDDLRESRA
jgi:sialic acid synthase SpsE